MLYIYYKHEGILRFNDKYYKNIFILKIYLLLTFMVCGCCLVCWGVRGPAPPPCCCPGAGIVGNCPFIMAKALNYWLLNNFNLKGTVKFCKHCIIIFVTGWLEYKYFIPVPLIICMFKIIVRNRISFWWPSLFYLMKTNFYK